VSANLDLVRSIYADWERGEWSDVDWADPQIEFVFVGGPDAGSWKGLAGMAEGSRDWLSAWEHLNAEVQEYRELDDGRVLVLTGLRGRGKSSGLDFGDIRTKTANLWHIGGGKVTRLVLYWDPDRALADLGLEG
jgi:ketosteroid isomerase-like protein